MGGDADEGGRRLFPTAKWILSRIVKTGAGLQRKYWRTTADGIKALPVDLEIPLYQTGVEEGGTPRDLCQPNPTTKDDGPLYDRRANPTKRLQERVESTPERPEEPCKRIHIRYHSARRVTPSLRAERIQLAE